MNSKLYLDSGYEEVITFHKDNITYYWLSKTDDITQAIILAVDYGIRYGDARKEDSKIIIPVTYKFENVKTKVLKTLNNIADFPTIEEFNACENAEIFFEQYLTSQYLLITEIE
jgi:hypothetical protein